MNWITLQKGLVKVFQNWELDVTSSCDVIFDAICFSLLLIFPQGRGPRDFLESSQTK